MRTKIVAGNWKMNTDQTSGLQLVAEIVKGLENIYLLPEIELAFGVPHPYLKSVADAIPDYFKSQLKVAGQNCHLELNGAYTGCVSAAMLKDVGCRSVILGHSERRKYFGETDALLHDKIKTAFSQNLTVIYCCGETLEEREGGLEEKVIAEQISTALFGFSAEQLKNIVIAYEPVWAIGTGKTASPEQAEAVHAFIRKSLADQYDETTADNMTILYGGSVKPANAADIFAKPNVDGGLIGGASLKSADFLAIVAAMVKSPK